MAELSVWIGDLGWGHFIYSSVFLIATISWDVMESAPSSPPEVEDMTDLTTWARVRMDMFHQVMASF